MDQANSKDQIPLEFDNGPHPRAQLGFIAVANADLTERDMFSMRPDGVGVHFTRVRMPEQCTISSLSSMEEALDDAIASLMPARSDVDVICYNCTAGSFVIGENKIVEKIETNRAGVKGTTLLTGVVEALKALEVKSIVMGTAYTDDINDLEYNYFVKQGFDVLGIRGMGLMTDMEMNRVSLASLKEFALSLDRSDADAVFMSCGALRSTEVVEQVEAVIRKPFLGSNHASMWHCLRLAGIKDQFEGFGRLLRTC
jgi:maleate isomerase